MVRKSTIVRIDCLDGLRALAALWVLVGHCFTLTGWTLPLLDKPDLGVDLFMMLSGFLMVFHYQMREQVEPWSRAGTWLKFWTRRFFRIAPLYYVLLIVALLTGPQLLAWRSELDRFLHLQSVWPAAYLDRSLSNLLAHLSFLFGMLPSYVARTPLPDWSLGLEMQFYAVFPALMLLIRKTGWIRTAALAMILAGAITHITWHLSWHYSMPAFLPFKIDIFLAGMLLAHSCRVDTQHVWAYFAAALVLVCEPMQGEASPERVMGRLAMVMALFALLLHGRLPGRLHSLVAAVSAALGSKPLRILGEISYSTYLLHLLVMAPVIVFITRHGGQQLSPVMRSAIALPAVAALVYPLSWLTYKFIELPGQELGRSLRRSPPDARDKDSRDNQLDPAESIAAP